jgi:hypothetical protein
MSDQRATEGSNYIEHRPRTTTIERFIACTCQATTENKNEGTKPMAKTPRRITQAGLKHLGPCRQKKLELPNAHVLKTRS